MAKAKDRVSALKAQWAKRAEDALLDRKIVAVRWMTPEEVSALSWCSAAAVLHLDDGSMIYPSADDEGNGPGALFGQDADGKDITLPVI